RSSPPTARLRSTRTPLSSSRPPSSTSDAHAATLLGRRRRTADPGPHEHLLAGLDTFDQTPAMLGTSPPRALVAYGDAAGQDTAVGRVSPRQQSAAITRDAVLCPIA